MKQRKVGHSGGLNCTDGNIDYKFLRKIYLKPIHSNKKLFGNQATVRESNRHLIIRASTKKQTNDRKRDYSPSW